MSWEHPDKGEHKSLSSVYQVWFGGVAHEGWDMRWYHEKTYKGDGHAISMARHHHGAARVVQIWFDGKGFQTDIIFETGLEE